MKRNLCVLVLAFAFCRGQTTETIVASSDATIPENYDFDTEDRKAVVELYKDGYLGSDNSLYRWNGKVATCEADSTPIRHQRKVLKRINFYRRLVCPRKLKTKTA